MQKNDLTVKRLMAFREICRERSVPNAAENLGGGQPAISLALSHLRRHFWGLRIWLWGVPEEV